MDLLILSGVISKHEIKYHKLEVVGEVAKINLYFNPNEKLYDDFKRDLVSSAFSLAYSGRDDILTVKDIRNKRD